MPSNRLDVSVAFVCFDFDGFANLNGVPSAQLEAEFVKQVGSALPSYAKRLDAELKDKSIADHTLEVFFLPVPSVDDMRKLFQDRIGWRP